MNTFARIESVCTFRDGFIKSISLIRQSNLLAHYFGKHMKLFWKTRWYVRIVITKVVFTNWQQFLFVSINTFMEVAASVTNISCIAQVTLKFINYTLLVNSGRLYFSKFKVFIEFSADEHVLNGGLKPSLNMQTDSIHAKVFTWRICGSFVIMVILRDYRNWYSIIYSLCLENGVTMTPKH